MDWLLLIGFLILIVLIGTGIFVWRGYISRIKHDYHAQRPALRITNLSVMNALNVITLTLELENIGPGVAYDCILQLAGWEGNFAVKAIHPQGSRYQKHSVPITLGPDAPIRQKLMSRCSLRVAYQDLWEQRYECWYPIVQHPNINTGLYNVQINLSQPELTEPHPSVREMWQFLRKTSVQE